MTARTLETANDPSASDDRELGIYHDAAHAVAAWKLGLPAGWMDTRMQRLRGSCLPAVTGSRTHRPSVEETAIALLAGSVAERLLRPMAMTALACEDHLRVHRILDAWEDGGVIFSWCDYLWQRSYALLAPGHHWMLVIALAGALNTHGTLTATAIDRYLRHVADLARPAEAGLDTVCTPWHREWRARAEVADVDPKGTWLPESVPRIDEVLDFRPIDGVLLKLSRRALGALMVADIRTVHDLGCWSEYALARLAGVGKLTVREIAAAAAAAAVRLAPPGTRPPGARRSER